MTSRRHSRAGANPEQFEPALGPRLRGDDEWKFGFGACKRQGMQRIARALKSAAPKGLTWYFEPMPQEQHHTIFHGAALKAFRTVFKPAEAAK